MAASHSFDTTRKSAEIAASLLERPISGVRLVEPEPLTDVQLAAVHDPRYVAAVKTGSPRESAESSGFSWDPGVWTAVCASNGGAVAAALHALRTRQNAGSLSSGLHHARRASGAGFCTFNGLALAAHAALEAGARRVLVVDVDAHMGDGTLSLVRDWPVIHLDITVSPWSEPFESSRASLDNVTDASEYLPTLRRRLEALDTTGIDVCLYNAGMDPYEGCAIGGLDGLTMAIIEERERGFFEWSATRQVPVAFVLAGGYTSTDLSSSRLVDLHRLTIAAATGASLPGGSETP